MPPKDLKTMENFEKIEKPVTGGVEAEEPIADLETNEAILKKWGKEGLNAEIIGLLDNDFEEKLSKDGKFILSADSFTSSKEFVRDTYHEFKKFDAKNWGDKLDEVKNNLRKIILTFTFNDLEINPEKPIIIREEKEKEGDKEIIRKYFATNRPGIVLASDKTDWWLERKGS